jgi:hypothetical protein
MTFVSNINVQVECFAERQTLTGSRIGAGAAGYLLRRMAASASRSTVWATPAASAPNATRSQTGRYRPRQR